MKCAVYKDCLPIFVSLPLFNENKMSDKRILIVNQEIMPFIPETDNSRLGRDLPTALAEKGCEVRTFMPKFGTINERRNQLHEVIRLSGMNISINDADHPLIIKVASLQPLRIQVYFMDNDDYFQKSASDVDTVGSNRADNDERAIFFARGSMETVKKLRWDPAVIQCQGWFSTFLPLYLHKMFAAEPSMRKCKIVYCIIDGEPAPIADSLFVRELSADDIPAEDLDEFKDMEFNADTLHKIAASKSDGVIFATPNVSEDVREYVKKTGVPVLEYDRVKDGNFDAYKEFYESLEDEK